MKMTVHVGIEEEVSEEMRDTVVALSGPPEHLTIAALVEAAVRREIRRLRRKHNGGGRFPERGGREPRSGRPVGGV